MHMGIQELHIFQKNLCDCGDFSFGYTDVENIVQFIQLQTDRIVHIGMGIDNLPCFFIWQGVVADGTLNDECPMYDEANGDFIAIAKLQLFQNIQ